METSSEHKLKEVQPGVFVFPCSGCGQIHHFTTNDNMWRFNNDLKAPSVRPSIKVGTKVNDELVVCQFFITRGKQQFAEACTHADKGNTKNMLTDLSAIPNDFNPDTHA